MLQLDHVSLEVSSMPAARRFLEEHLGFTVTVPLHASLSHSRIFLDRGYIEVHAPSTSRLASLEMTVLRQWAGYYLRPPEISRYAAWAVRRGLPVVGPERYRGVDGEWLDLMVERAPWGRLLPVITQRTAPAEMASDWPPALPVTHPNGVQSLLGIYMVIPDAVEVGKLIEALVDRDVTVPIRRPVINAFLQSEEYAITLPNGRVLLLERPRGPGRAAEWLRDHGAGIMAALFGTPALGATHRFFLRRQVPTLAFYEEPVQRTSQLWLSPYGDLGVSLVFTEQS